MVLSHGSNDVFCLPDLHFCEFCIYEFGASEAQLRRGQIRSNAFAPHHD